MHRTTSLVAAATALTLVASLWPTPVEAQRRRSPPRRGAVVFVGGYFYDPFYGPYPWWAPGMYAWHYAPVFDDRAEVRLKVEPKHAAVYVDGYYAGTVDDFDGVFQRLPLTPGPHDIDFHLEDYQTAHQHLYVGPGTEYTVRDRLERLAPGEISAPPRIAPPLPPPPAGSARLPRSPAPYPPPSPVERPSGRASFGTLAIRVQPIDAQVLIDGAVWSPSAGGEPLAVHVSDGLHHVEVQKSGFKTYSGEMHVRAGQTTTLNVSLTPDS